MHSLSTFGAKMNHMQIRTHKIHHSSNLGETTTFPLIVFFVLGHGTYTQMSFCFRTPKLGFLKFPKIGTPRTLKAYNFFYKPPIEMKFKAKL